MHAVSRGVGRLQRELAASLELTPERRTETVVGMLLSNARRAPGYWIQLTLSMGIATLGLVLSSTAVVIGAMLVSPLMGPIIELGMGFAVGSSLLVIRSFIRVSLSVAWVVASAALVTVLLPFHEITPEIASRTAPTALDLLVAAFCALTAAYTTARAASDTTAAAAGTAVGIALVPPLCAAGYGLGTASLEVASGAGLLFTANFSAIVVLAALSFMLLGYHEVDAETLEREVLTADASRTERLAERAHRRLRSLFGSRYGVTMRIVVPTLFLLAVYVPLGRALDEVAWQVRVRNAVNGILEAERSRLVQTVLTAERDAVALRLVRIGSPDSAEALERRLSRRIAATVGVLPTVSVIAVPDAAAWTRALANRAPGAGVPAASPDVGSLRQRIAATLGDEWPGAVAGPLAGWTLEVMSEGTVRLRLTHLGAPLGMPAESLLARRLTSAIGSDVQVSASAWSVDTVRVSGEGHARWLQQAISSADAIEREPGLFMCVAVPASPSPSSRAQARHRQTLDALLETPAARQGRLVRRTGDDGWAFWIVAAGTSCGRDTEVS